MDAATLRTQFQQDGYVFIPGFLSANEMAELHEHIRQFMHDVVPGLPPERAFYERKDDPSTLKQLFNMFEYDPYFAQLMNDSTFSDLASLVLDEPVVAQNVEYFNKPPQIGKPTPPHQDNYYFMLEPASAVTMWLALEDVDAENGCVRYVKGSHLTGMRSHGRTQTLGFSQGITDFPNEADRAAEVAFPAKPGDLLIHHSMAVHWADGNKSLTRTRKALGFIYFGESAKENTEAKEAYRQKLKAETLV